MSTNISKKKRDDLLDKIKQIRAFIAAAPQDENTGNLLSYLSDLEKDVNGKKYGLVFEEHREEIDEVLDTHTPVLTEDADLFIDHGGQMNFLIEGDNLASLKLLEKTHKGKIDLIYIDPPYNTGASNWIYDNDYVDGNDLFKHSKWLSMMQSRLTLAKNLLTDKGVLICAIDENESATLRLLLDDIFGADYEYNCIILTAVISLKYYYESISPSKEVESVLLIDELDATLHPAFQIKLLNLFREMSEKYKIQVVFTTHSICFLVLPVK